MFSFYGNALCQCQIFGQCDHGRILQCAYLYGINQSLQIKHGLRNIYLHHYLVVLQYGSIALRQLDLVHIGLGDLITIRRCRRLITLQHDKTILHLGVILKTEFQFPCQCVGYLRCATQQDVLLHRGMPQYERSAAT